MQKRTTVVLTGAFSGGLLGIALLVLFTGRFSAYAFAGNDGGGQLVVTSGALYLATVAAALIGGTIVAAIAYGSSSSTGNTETRFAFVHVLPFGLIVAVVAGYSVLRAGVGLAGDAQAGIVSIPVISLAITAFVAGLVAGMLVSWVVSTLAAKRVVGLEGEAAPASTAVMLKAATRAVTVPILAIVIIAALAIALSQLLLATQGMAATGIFAGAAALVLLGAAGAAYLGGPKNG